MTVIEITWVATLSVAVLCAALDMFVGWFGEATWKQVVQAIVLQWLALALQVLVLAVALLDKG